MKKVSLVGLLLWIPFVLSSGFRPLVVLGNSMAPELRPGQVVLLDRHYYQGHPLEHGQVVAFQWQGRTYVKRVYALPGDTVRLLCNEGYCSPIIPEHREKSERLAQRASHVTVRTTVVPPDHFYSLGDHAFASIDSRELGPIPSTAILGRVRPF